MKSFATLASLITAAAAAGAPAGTSICDYYTTALLTNNTAANQQTLLTLVVNTAVIGNYTTPNVGVAVPGILTAGTYKGTKVNLLPYFSGALASTNLGGTSGVAVDWLDGGGATPLMSNMAADATDTNQYTLLTHLYEYFAYLLGCSMYGNTTMPYSGFDSMYEVHKYMGLSEAEFMYFVMNVGLSAESFGVAAKDVTAVGDALVDAFGYRCSPPEAIPDTASPSLQAICIDSSCPIATSGAVCSSYASVVEPTSATATLATTVNISAAATATAASTSASASATSSESMSTAAATTTAPAYTGGAAALLPGFGVAVVGAAAMLL